MKRTILSLLASTFCLTIAATSAADAPSSARHSSAYELVRPGATGELSGGYVRSRGSEYAGGVNAAATILGRVGLLEVGATGEYATGIFKDSRGTAGALAGLTWRVPRAPFAIDLLAEYGGHSYTRVGRRFFTLSDAPNTGDSYSTSYRGLRVGFLWAVGRRALRHEIGSALAGGWLVLRQEPSRGALEVGLAVRGSFDLTAL